MTTLQTVGAMPAPVSAGEPTRVRLGRVVSVSGGRVIAIVQPHAEHRPDLQVGTLIKIPRRRTIVLGIVEGVTIPMLRQHDDEVETRLAEINLIGEMEAGTRAFSRGVSSMPCLDDAVLAVDSADTEAVYALPQRHTVPIGFVQQDPTVPARISVDGLLTRHFAIVGATGTGKSCALALLLQGIIAANPNGHILLLDSHGEYGPAFGEQAEHLLVDRLRLPYWLLEFEELTEVLFAEDRASMAAEIALLRQFVLRARQSYYSGREEAFRVTVDTPSPYTLAEVGYQIDSEMGRLNNQTSLGPLTRLKARLATVQADPRFSFIFPGQLFLTDDLASILGQLFRLPADGKPICRLDLSGVSSEILNVVVAVLARLAFSLGTAIGQQVPLLLVCEEAHRYAPQDAALGFEPAKRALARIAKEGRKYGIGLGLLSQRPSDLAVSILSQCGTVIALRMVSTADQEVIQAALSDASAALVNSLPLLGNGEAIVVGEGVSVPMRLHLARLPKEKKPRSNSAQFATMWKSDTADADMLDRVIALWRGSPADY